MTSIDDLTAEVMKGLSEYAELTDKAMKKAVRKTATAKQSARLRPLSRMRFLQMRQKRQDGIRKAGRQRKSRKTAIP